MNKKVMWGGIGLLIFSVLTFICWAATSATWTWTGTVKTVVSVGHYEDSDCEQPLTAHQTLDVETGYSFTSYVENDGTVPVTLEINIVKTGYEWITVTPSYTEGTTILVDEVLSITWDLTFVGHGGDTFTLDITITASEAP